MHQYFKFSRFLSLLKNHLVESKKKYYLFTVSVAAIGILMVILFLIFGRLDDFNCYCELGTDKITSYYRQNDDWQIFMFILYWTGLLGFGGMFALNSFINFGNSGEAVFYMNKPASIFEKWLLEVVVRVVLFYLVYTTLYYVIFGIGNMIIGTFEYNCFHTFYINHPYTFENSSNYCPDKSMPIFEKSSLYMPWKAFTIDGDYEPKLVQLLHAVLITGVGFFMYGAVLFNRFSFFKTFLFGFGIFIFYLLYGFVIGFNNNVFIDNPWVADIVDTYAYNSTDGNLYIRLEDDALMPIMNFLLWFIPLSVLSLSFFALKEKEV
jgi:hypothetical protein